MLDLFHHEPLLLIGLVALVGFYFGGLARRARLPSIIGYMFLGVLLGPSLLGLFDHHNLDQLGFITEIALGFVAFGIGSELSLRALRQLGSGIVAIIFAESFTAFAVVTLAVFAVTRSWPVALLFGGVAPASAPAGTVAVIQEYRAKGNLTKALYAVVGFDDGLAIIIFGFAAALAKVLLVSKLEVAGAGGGFLYAMKEPLVEIAGSLAIGIVTGFLFSALVRKLEAGRDMLILTFGVVMIATALAEHFHCSLILTNMIIGFILVNTRREAFVHRVTEPLQEIMPLLFILFFCLAGAHLKLGDLPSLGVLGVVYILARTAGLIGGARIGSAIGHVEPNIKKYIGLGILSQAGVAIGLSLIVREKLAELAATPEVATAVEAFRAMHLDVSGLHYDPLMIGSAMITTVTATCIVFEIIGPICTKIALERAGEIQTERPGAKP
jgi:Kef-type K+ transport system membrane component KefB